MRKDGYPFPRLPRLGWMCAELSIPLSAPLQRFLTGKDKLQLVTGGNNNHNKLYIKTCFLLMSSTNDNRVDERRGRSSEQRDGTIMSQGLGNSGDSRPLTTQSTGLVQGDGGGDTSNDQSQKRGNRQQDTSSGIINLAAQSSDPNSTTESGSGSGKASGSQQPAAAKGRQGKEGTTNSTGNPKKDRSKLRKGKWTVEEEEYTSRIIQHFSTGLLTLPEGATLRSYLADKLNCDPMRITKKFTGACCLGRRVYHLRDRPRASPGEIEMVKAELDHLEQRFRLRVEHEQSGLPLSRRQEVLLAQPQHPMSTLYPLQNSAVSTGVPPWMSNYGASLGVGMNPQLSLALQAARGVQEFQAAARPQVGSVQPNTASWLLPGNTAEASAPVAPAPQPDPSIQLLNNIVASWAFAQAASSLAPVLPHLGLGAQAPAPPPVATAAAAPPTITTSQAVRQEPPQSVNQITEQQSQQDHGRVAVKPNVVVHQEKPRPTADEMRLEEQQRQLRLAYEENLKAQAAKEKEEQDAKKKAEAEAALIASVEAASPAETVQLPAMSPAEQLQRSYEAHLRSIGMQRPSDSRDVSSRQPESAAVNRSMPRPEEVQHKAQSLQTLQVTNQQKINESSMAKLTKSEMPAKDSRSNRGQRRKGENRNVSDYEGSSSEDHKTVPKGAADAASVAKPLPVPASESAQTADEEAGTILLGFLNSLRRSYEDAVEEKSPNQGTENTVDQKSGEDSSAPQRQGNEAPAWSHLSQPQSKHSPKKALIERSGSVEKRSKRSRDERPQDEEDMHQSCDDSEAGIASSSPAVRSLHQSPPPRTHSTRPASVTDTSTLSRSETSSGASSSQPAESSSSLEDSDSKSDKTDPSSSEESEKEPAMRTSKGPPRKRLKSSRKQQFTAENLKKHRKRMSEQYEKSSDLKGKFK